MNEKELYLKLCASENDLPLFHKNWWLDIACPAWDVVMVTKGDQVTGVWPYPKEQKIGISISRNPALTPYLGPHVFFPKDLKESKKDNYEHEVLRSLFQKVPNIKIWNAACRPGLKQIGLFKEHEFNTGFRQTFIIDLCESEDNLLGAMHEDFRRSIRKASTDITITNETELIDLLYEYQVATLVRNKESINYTKEKMKELFQKSLQMNSCALWVARKEGKILAMLWNLRDDVRAYYLVSSKNPEIDDNHVMPALVWHAMKHSKSLGKISFDFEGSMIPGVERFFRNFGGRRELYPILQKTNSMTWEILKGITSLTQK